MFVEGVFTPVVNMIEVCEGNGRGLGLGLRMKWLQFNFHFSALRTVKQVHSCLLTYLPVLHMGPIL